MGTQKYNVKNDKPFTKGNTDKKTESKWKFKGTGSQLHKKSSKRESFSNDRKNAGKGKKKSSTRVFNSEGVGPNYKKAPSGKRKNMRVFMVIKGEKSDD